MTITLERAATVSGRVVDPDGKPVAGATVDPALTGTFNSLTGDARFAARTGDDGRFKLVLPASGVWEYNLVAHDGKYLEWRRWANGVLPPLQTEPGEAVRNVEIKLSRPASVRGRVTGPDGRPVARREVRSGAADRMENRYYDPTVTTADDGTYELKFIRAGEQFIQVAPFWLRCAAGTARDQPHGDPCAGRYKGRCGLPASESWWGELRRFRGYGPQWRTARPGGQTWLRCP